MGVDVGTGVGVETGVGIGTGVGMPVGSKVGTGVAIDGVAVRVDVGVGVEAGISVGVGTGVTVGSADGAGTRVDVGDGWSAAVAVAGITVGVAVGVSAGGGPVEIGVLSFCVAVGFRSVADTMAGAPAIVAVESMSAVEESARQAVNRIASARIRVVPALSVLRSVR
ncbi:MAG: hypothetical protein IH960_09575 [Chloroflexi bacterium]|nr:hypothetical protein [Chloroflexota bacterium]